MNKVLLAIAIILFIVGIIYYFYRNNVTLRDNKTTKNNKSIKRKQKRKHESDSESDSDSDTDDCEDIQSKFEQFEKRQTRNMSQ
jgi:uncharacterized protein YxeA